MSCALQPPVSVDEAVQLLSRASPSAACCTPPLLQGDGADCRSRWCGLGPSSTSKMGSPLLIPRLTEASLIGACDVSVALKKAESQFRIIDCDMLQKDDLSACLRTDLVCSRPFLTHGFSRISASGVFWSQAAISLLLTFSSFRDQLHWAAVMPSYPTPGVTMQTPSGMPCSPGSMPSVLALDVLQVFGWTKHDTWKQFGPCPPLASACAPCITVHCPGKVSTSRTSKPTCGACPSSFQDAKLFCYSAGPLISADACLNTGLLWTYT